MVETKHGEPTDGNLILSERNVDEMSERLQEKLKKEIESWYGFL